MNECVAFTIESFEVEAYFIPIVGQFNSYPFLGAVSGSNDSDTTEVVDEYMRRFDDAWKKLAEK